MKGWKGRSFISSYRISLLNRNPSMVVQNLETWYMVTSNSAGCISHISLKNVWKRKVKSNKSVRWLDEPSQVKQASSAERRLLGFLLEWATLATCHCYELWNEAQAGQDNGKAHKCHYFLPVWVENVLQFWWTAAIEAAESSLFFHFFFCGFKFACRSHFQLLHLKEYDWCKLIQ